MDCVGISKFGQVPFKFPGGVTRDHGHLHIRILIGQAKENPSKVCKTEVENLLLPYLLSFLTGK